MGGAVVATAGSVLSGQKSTGAKPAFPKADGAHRIMTCNILLDLPEHTGNMSWKEHRREATMTVIQSRKPDILCLQEVGPGQLVDFKQAFPGYESFGFVDPKSDTNPPRFSSIRNVIFYDSRRYSMISQGKYWLSEKPQITASRFDKTRIARHVSWVRLKDQVTAVEFRMLNTHFNLTQPARQFEADVLVKEAAQYPDDFPQLAAGDFNAEAPSPEIQTLLKAGWSDTNDFVSKESIGSEGNFVPLKRKIDYIFYKGPVRPLTAELIREAPGGIEPSDHPFFRADVLIETKPN